ncbi:hypothetical protein TorRG33x02_037410 [Trema orientale]|uniref:Uncharacterized protein n=1 Tax=Trema orientale TaxID=63057 RepID=A0A2P5FR85_TREOI|nr:hypothetical protein TorRG33x02_037410 [Trema orientale]
MPNTMVDRTSPISEQGLLPSHEKSHDKAPKPLGNLERDIGVGSLNTYEPNFSFSVAGVPEVSKGLKRNHKCVKVLARDKNRSSVLKD